MQDPEFSPSTTDKAVETVASACIVKHTISHPPSPYTTPLCLPSSGPLHVSSQWPALVRSMGQRDNSQEGSSNLLALHVSINTLINIEARENGQECNTNKSPPCGRKEKWRESPHPPPCPSKFHLSVFAPFLEAVIKFGETKFSITEPSGPGESAVVKIPVIRQGDTSKVSIVRVHTKDGSATSGEDYHPVSEGMGLSRVVSCMKGAQ